MIISRSWVQPSQDILSIWSSSKLGSFVNPSQASLFGRWRHHMDHDGLACLNDRWWWMDGPWCGHRLVSQNNVWTKLAGSRHDSQRDDLVRIKHCDMILSRSAPSIWKSSRLGWRQHAMRRSWFQQHIYGGQLEFAKHPFAADLKRNFEAAVQQCCQVCFACLISSFLCAKMFLYEMSIGPACLC
jgi:hypothetical protein